LSGTYEGGFTTDGFWMLSYVFAGAAALHPSMKLLTSRADDHQTRSAGFRLVLLTGAFLCVPAVMGGQAILDDHIDVGVVVTASVILVVLISMRMWGLITEIEGKVHLLQEQEGTLRSALSERDQLTEQLKYMAFHDSLTGVANRELFLSRMTVALAGRRKEESGTVVLFTDIDDFKDVNDNYGHMAGDALLRTVSNRLQACVRGGDTVSRMGGDEFAMLLNDADEETAQRVADRVLEAMEAPIQLGSSEIRITVSIGIAVAHDEENSADELLRRADVAMYQVKRSGKRSYAFWSAPGGMIPAF
jgi:diguanylate cyclase (GGDEF)-like protein